MEGGELIKEGDIDIFMAFVDDYVLNFLVPGLEEGYKQVQAELGSVGIEVKKGFLRLGYRLLS